MSVGNAVWQEAPRYGKSVLGFIAMKSPITLPAAAPQDEGDAFTPSMFMERQMALQQSIGLCIDLTSAPEGKQLYDRQVKPRARHPTPLANVDARGRHCF